VTVWTCCNYWVCCFAGKVKYSCVRSIAVDSSISLGTVAAIRTYCEDKRWMQLAQDNCSRLSSVSAEQNFRTVYLTTWNQQPFLIAVYSDQLTAVAAWKLKKTDGRTTTKESHLAELCWHRRPNAQPPNRYWQTSLPEVHLAPFVNNVSQLKLQASIWRGQCRHFALCCRNTRSAATDKCTEHSNWFPYAPIDILWAAAAAS